jgi:hypothetical protein
MIRTEQQRIRARSCCSCGSAAGVDGGAMRGTPRRASARTPRRHLSVVDLRPLTPFGSSPTSSCRSFGKARDTLPDLRDRVEFHVDPAEVAELRDHPALRRLEHHHLVGLVARDPEVVVLVDETSRVRVRLVRSYRDYVDIAVGVRVDPLRLGLARRRRGEALDLAAVKGVHSERTSLFQKGRGSPADRNAGRRRGSRHSTYDRD